KQFELLQMRPLVISYEQEELDVENISPEDLLCQSEQVLGNGAITTIFDIVVVDIEKFDRGKSRAVASEVSTINSKLLNQKRPYILMGVGRGGIMDACI